MAKIVTNCGARRTDCVVSFLIVGSAELCHQVADGLHECAKQRGWQILVHKCEFVAQVLELKYELGIDFIIFTFDWRITQSVFEIEANISLIDEYYIISGTICLVNCKGIPNVMGLTSHISTKIREKYNIRLLTANTADPQSCSHLADRILNLVECIFGITSGIPTNALTKQ